MKRQNPVGGLRIALAGSILLATSCALGARAQDLAAEKPLPDIPTLMRQVESNQRAFEAIEKDYIYRESSHFDSLDSHEGVKKSQSRDFEIFWINGVRVARTLAKDGKPLSADEATKENERIDSEVKKARERRDKADAQGKETDSRGHDEITASRILELGAFSNPRREQINGRDTIVVDYTGDPQAKTRNAAENAFRELAGTVWVDEQDKTLQHCEGHFDHDFKVGGGLVASVKQGTWFKFSARKINDEVWLPESLEFDGHARYLLFFSINGHGTVRASDYRKFKATSTILPGVTTVAPETTDPSKTPQ
jgi:hypothetical protein